MARNSASRFDYAWLLDWQLCQCRRSAGDDEKVLVAVETEYTVLVSSVTELLVSLVNQLHQPVTDLRSNKDVKQAIARAQKTKATAAAKRQS